MPVGDLRMALLILRFDVRVAEKILIAGKKLPLSVAKIGMSRFFFADAKGKTTADLGSSRQAVC
jgi:hypothetical protein